ncbi:MAG: hypothetical protein NVSMB59_01810 [Vulcanimicrobiaceae bacterium]
MLNRPAFLRVLGALGSGIVAVPSAAAAADAPPAARLVYLATYSHVDPDWLWPYQEGEQQAHATFRSVLGILDAFPDLRFSMTSAVHYKWVRESDPALFARIVAAVARRQWEPLGGWWVEADTNVPSGESLMRQAAYGQAEFERAFGVRSKIAFLPDSFGSSANLPEILRAQGMTGYVLKRGEFEDGTTPPPARFTWQGLGESTIAAYKLPLWNGSNDVPAKLAELAAMKIGGDPPLVVFGLGDHGGGPSRAAMRSIETYRKTTGAVALAMTRIDDFFARATPAPQRLRGELGGDLVGSYVNAGNYKRALVAAERTLLDIERYDVMWHLGSGSIAPPPDLTDAWQTLLARCHHDTVSGTAAQESMRSAREDLDAIAVTGRRTATRVLEKIVDRIAHPNPDDYVVAVFNPLEREVDVPVVHVVGAGSFSHDADYTLRDVPTAAFDATGASLPLQIAQADDGLFSGAIYPLATRVRVPAFGYATVHLRKVQSVAVPRDAPAFSRELRNESIAVTFDEKTGQPASILDARGNELLREPAKLVAYVDHADTWGRFGVPVRAQDVAGQAVVQSMRAMERGPARSVLRVWTTYGTSSIRQDWSLAPGEATLRCELRASWHENQTRLAFALAPRFAYANATYDVPFGRVTRALSEFVKPASSWMSVGTAPSLALVGAGAKAFWAAPSGIGMNLLRAGPFVSQSENVATYTPDQLQDVGDAHASFAIVTDAGDPAALTFEGERCGRVFPAQWVGVHDGAFPPRRSFLSLDPTLALASLRRDLQRPRTLVARTYDVSGRRHRATTTIAGRRYVGDYDAFGIRTLRIADGNGTLSFRD